MEAKVVAQGIRIKTRPNISGGKSGAGFPADEAVALISFRVGRMDEQNRLQNNLFTRQKKNNDDRH